MGIKGGGPGNHPIPLNFNGIETSAKPDHHGAYATIPHDQVRPDPHGKDRDGGVEGGQKRRQIRFIRRLEQPVRRAADAQPSQV